GGGGGGAVEEGGRAVGEGQRTAGAETAGEQGGVEAVAAGHVEDGRRGAEGQVVEEALQFGPEGPVKGVEQGLIGGQSVRAGRPVDRLDVRHRGPSGRRTGGASDGPQDLHGASRVPGEAPGNGAGRAG